MSAFRAGHVALVGRPNVGKSTLLNALIGFKLSIVSPKPQTTRHRILGISTHPDGQIAFVDTPGLHESKGRAISRYLNRAAAGSLGEVDVAALLIEAGQWRDADEHVYRAVQSAQVPRVLVINKVDRIKDKRALLPFIAQVTAERAFDAVYPVSALRGTGVEELQRSLLQMLPEQAALYGEDELTDRSERFLAAELIREQLMMQLGEELPYSSTVEIEQFVDTPGLLRIAAIVWVERPGQKAIVIGRGGERMRSLGTAARVQMERMFEKKVFLELWCKVREDWSDDEQALRRFGYQD